MKTTPRVKARLAGALYGISAVPAGFSVFVLQKLVVRGDPAATRFRTLRVGASAALVEASPETGRTHQIRVHLAHLGAPLLGDARYGGPRRIGELAIPRVMLHAHRLELAHPASGARLVLEAPVPEDFATLQRELLGPGE